MEYVALWLYICGIPLYLTTISHVEVRENTGAVVCVVLCWPMMVMWFVMEKLSEILLKAIKR